MAKGQGQYIIEFEAWQRAMRERTRQVAVQLQPRHRKAVQAIAAALEQLSIAMTMEIEIRDELASTAPLAETAWLPNACIGLHGIGRLADAGSPASEWARQMRRLEILK